MDTILLHKYFFRTTLLLLLIFTAAVVHFGFQTQEISQETKNKQTKAIENLSIVTSKSSDEKILGANYKAPQIFIYGGDDTYSSGGMIAMASTDEPAVYIGGYEINGEVEIGVYKANEAALMDYLLHDKEGKQIKKQPDVGSFEYIGVAKGKLQSNSYDGTKVSLPLEGSGIWYLSVNVGGRVINSFVLRSNVGVFATEGKNEFIFWGQNFKNKRSISTGSLKILNLQDSINELQSVSFEEDGTTKANLSSKADIALYSQDGDIAIVPLNLRYLNMGYSYEYFVEQKRKTRYFIFTDRPLYRPGDTINFKAIAREDDDARYTIQSGNITARIYDEEYYPSNDNENKVTPIYEKSLPISAGGTINGSFKLPESSKTGYYKLILTNPADGDQMGSYHWENYSASDQTFMVQHFRKPESFIEITIPEKEIIAGDKASFTLNGSYFSGQPLIDKDIKYTITAADFYEYQYLNDLQFYSSDISDDFRYYYSYGKEVKKGTIKLDENGQAEIEIPTKMDFNDGKNQIFTIEATLDESAENPNFARKNLLIYSGEFGIYRSDSSYGGKVNTQLNLPLILKPNKDSKDSLANIPLAAKVHRTHWKSVQEKDKKYPTYKSIEEDLPDIAARTNDKGEATFNFTPKDIGSYMFTVSGRDGRDNIITKKFYSYISKDGEAYYSEAGGDDISIAADKQKYNPGDNVRLNIFSKIPDRDIFLTLERGRVDRYQVVHMNGKNGSVNVQINHNDVPNMYAKASSFSSSNLESAQTNLVVSTLSKKIKVDIQPDAKTYGPGSTVRVNVKTTDGTGKPVAAEVALWAVDKAIFELADNNLGDIFNNFWQERYNSTTDANSLEGITVLSAEGGGGCFAPTTRILMGDGTIKQIKDVKVGDYILTRTEKSSQLVKAKVSGTQKAEDSGYLIVNGTLKITPDHILRVNDQWLQAGSIQAGDMLTIQDGSHERVRSIEWQAGKFTVYNLEIEKYHTFIADGVWVHNQKGESRTVFKDTAYWNPSIQTDSSGSAQVTFKLPDNLTTWTIASVASTTDTKVGQATEEIIVGKSITIRPILPNILRVDDEVILSALAQNFTEKDETFNIDFSFDSGEVKETPTKTVTIKARSQEELKWKVKATKENSKSKLMFSLKSQTNPDLSDVVTLDLPIRPFGFIDKRAETGDKDKTYKIDLDESSSKSKTSIDIYMSSSMVGTLQSGMNYLIDYPYGCVEQTTSRFVPAVIAKNNSSIFAQALSGKNTDEIITKGIQRLSTLQQGDGGWAWWTNGTSDPFVTAYVVEYLLEAQKSGAAVEQNMLKRAENFLAQNTYYDLKKNTEMQYTTDAVVAKNYALTLLGKKNAKIPEYNQAEANPDIFALYVMTKYMNGDTNPNTNGLNKLIDLGQTQGDSLFWKSGSKSNFGSIEGSTAMAMRAILMAGGDRELAAKAARYLTRNRNQDYWSNTFGTAQVVRAMTELAKTNNELAPNYSYKVALDGKDIKTGVVNSPNQILDPIKLPADSIKSNGSNLVLSHSGDGQLYSTLVINEFKTDRKAKAIDHGLSITRNYKDLHGTDSSIDVGDIVTVQLTVKGLKTNESYGVIVDELPAGLVPINEAFKNEQFGYPSQRSYSEYDITDREYTENGVVLSIYKLSAGSRTYSYTARAVSEGTFAVPPATASLMYAPEVYGRSNAQTLKIGKESKISILPDDSKTTAMIIGGSLVGIALCLLILKKLKKTKESGSQGTPQQNPPTMSPAVNLPQSTPPVVNPQSTAPTTPHQNGNQ